MQVRFLLLLLLALAVATFALAPRRNEQMTMLADQARHAEIVVALEQRLRDGDTNDATLHGQLSRAYAAQGRIEDAIRILEEYVALHGSDAGVFGRLADLYRMTGALDRQAEALDQSLALRPTVTRALERADLYRKAGDSVSERAVLSRFEAEATIKNGLFRRLGDAHAKAGDLEAAIRVLQASEPPRWHFGAPQNSEERLILGGLLAKADQPDLLVKAAHRWIREWREPWYAARLLYSVAEATQSEVVNVVADMVVAMHPDIRFYLASNLVKSGAINVARHLVSGWPASVSTPSMNDLAGFLSAVRDVGDPGIVWHGFAQVLNAGASAEVAARYIDAISSEFGIGAIAPFLPHLKANVLGSRPLLAARVAFHENHISAARVLAAGVDPLGLTSGDRQLWIDLLSAISTQREVVEILNVWFAKGRLDRDLLDVFARLSGSLGLDRGTRAARDAMARQAP